MDIDAPINQNEFVAMLMERPLCIWGECFNTDNVSKEVAADNADKIAKIQAKEQAQLQEKSRSSTGEQSQSQSQAESQSES